MKTIRTTLDKDILAVEKGPQAVAAEKLRQALARKLGVSVSESDTVKHGLAALGEKLEVPFPLVVSPRTPTE